jgi:hypothetical protein
VNMSHCGTIVAHCGTCDGETQFSEERCEYCIPINGVEVCVDAAIIKCCTCGEVQIIDDTQELARMELARKEKK